MLSVQQFRMFDFAFCALIKVLLFPLYWDLSSFLATIYPNYLYLSLKCQPLISSFLPEASSSLLVSSSLRDICPYKPDCVSTGILFVYCFQGLEI